MNKIKVLFVCVHNSARSQMAEAFLNSYGSESFQAESAGLEPGNLNPMVVQVMREIGFDISQNETNSVFDFFKQERKYNFVITVCDGSNSERCPIFPGRVQRIHWSFADPSSFKGSDADKLEKTRKVRDQIKKQILEFIEEKKNLLES